MPAGIGVWLVYISSCKLQERHRLKNYDIYFIKKDTVKETLVLERAYNLKHLVDFKGCNTTIIQKPSAK